MNLLDAEYRETEYRETECRETELFKKNNNKEIDIEDDKIDNK